MASASQLKTQERALQALALRAAVAEKGLRALTDRLALGRQEVDILLGLLQQRDAPEQTFARNEADQERAANELARTQAYLQILAAELSDKEQALSPASSQAETSASASLAMIRPGRAWSVAQALRRTRLRLLPAGSVRGRLARLGVRSLRTWRQEGFAAVVRKIFRKFARLLLRFETPVSPSRPTVVEPAAGDALAADQNVCEPAALAAAPIPSGEAPRLHVDEFLQLDETSYYVKGWLWGEGPGAAVDAIGPDGARTPLESLYRFVRPDIFEYFGVAARDQGDRRPAFIGYFQTKDPSYLVNGWTIECRAEQGAAARYPAPPFPGDLPQMRNSVLADLLIRDGDTELLLERHIGPALQRLQARLARAEVVRIDQYGTPPSNPLASLVIPLYGRIDFLEHQLAQFVLDAEVCRADVIYVLDSPELTDALRTRALQLSRLYPVPFRVVNLKRNVGFAGATNAGTDLARGRLLVLFNSDVLPDRPGWLGQMAAFYLKTPGVGALGPKLVYEDETLQHAGMYFARQTGSAVWENAHYYKGMHRYFPPATRTRTVPAVTGACLMIGHDRYREIGGLHNQFVQGDYEDSDLCLRLVERGYDNWYLADCELYHLEGQSYPGPLRSLTYQFNSWLQTHLWGERMEALMDKFSAAPPALPFRRAA